ncbi:HAD family hydrolase [Marinagarivorans algicola]|uniref:histidinol-phosphatase n=1 Tax=Marinagarivorans algicola TaxID=1513270 RepID=UPI0006B4BCC1|nr:HAD family hydrolase [Marinagarivorans algicola]
MTLALFDLDNTLLNGDSDHAFGEFLCQQGIVDRTVFKHANDQFYIDYQEGTLDIAAYIKFALAPLTRLSAAKRLALQAQFMTEVVEPMILKKGVTLLAKHRREGHTIVIITATNRFVTGPIARRLGVQHLIATEPEIVDGQFTGAHSGTPCFQEGKITCLNQWLSQHDETLEGSYFYSDSANDIPLLQSVDHPVAVDPCPKLAKYAASHNVPIMSLR